ncbi:MAG: hypothetical protein BMS9Abin11_0794 [Gammaproteobacteria bacterium]|nr:MAG: hypothetical protein BMS9Abin11_0794 [Gammaproteobacteria bacterium]
MMTASPRSRIFFLAIMAILFAGSLDVVVAKQIIDKKTGGIETEQQGLRIFVMPRRPGHMTAFYEGRGLPQNAIRHLKDVCYFTIGMRQQKKRIVWMEPGRWQFKDQHGRQIKRFSREHWDELWRKLKVPDGPRVTFGWAQLPNARDLRYQEPVGGMVMLVPTTGPISLLMDFRTNADKKGPAIRVWLHGLRCMSDEKES